MSKSLGTGIDPLDLIEGGPRPPVFAHRRRRPGEFPAYGADAVRWGLLAMSSGQDVRFSEDKVAQGQQLTNKLWNAARLILLGCRRRLTPGRAAAPAAVEDRWILSRLERARAEVAARIERYDFSHAALALYDFIYGELCDWYLELVKPRLRAGEPELAAHAAARADRDGGARPSADPVRDRGDLLPHPGRRGPAGGAACAERAGAAIDEAAEAAIGDVIEAVQALRAWRDSAEVKAGATLPARLRPPATRRPPSTWPGWRGWSWTAATARSRPRACRSPAARWRSWPPTSSTSAPPSASATRGAPSSRPRSSARERKLANQGFVAKAPAAVVQAEREKLERLRESELGAVADEPAARPSATCCR